MPTREAIVANPAHNGGRADFAIWDPITGRSTLTCRPVRYTVHMTAVRAADIYGPGKGPGGTYAHYHMPRRGRGRQHQELHHWSYADLGGNGRTISAETEGIPGDSMTEDQLDAHAHGFADAVLHRGVPNRIATWDDTTGLAWHRLGIRGNFRPFNRNDPTTWTGVQTGQQWTRAFGKTCPTDNFIRQIPEIYRRAQLLIRGGKLPTTTTTTPTTTDWFAMASESDLRRIIREEAPGAVWGYKNPKVARGKEDVYSILRNNPGETAYRTWAYKGKDQPRDAYSWLLGAAREVAAAAGERAGLLKAVEQLAAGKSIDPAEIEAAARQGVSSALKALEADVTLTLAPNIDSSEK